MLHPVHITRRLTARALEPAHLNHDPAQTPRAPPPLLLHVAAHDPVRVHRLPTLRNVLLVIVAQMVAEVVTPVERRVPARTLGVITVVRLFALVGPMLVLVVPVEVGVAPKGDRLATRNETAVSVRSLESVGG